MDTGQFEFEQIIQDQKAAIEYAYERTNNDILGREFRAKVKKLSIFEVGEEVKIKNSDFKIQSIGNGCLVLKLLPKVKRPLEEMLKC